jgi:hypothetical protein
MKQKLILCVIFLISLCAQAQQRTELRGNIINSATKEPVAGVLVTLRGQNQSQVSDARGEFHFTSAAPGSDVLSLTSTNITSREVPVQIEVNSINLVSDIKVIVTEAFDNMSMINVMDEAFLDDEGSNQSISSMIILSNDVYLNKVGYQLSPFRFKVRGYDNYLQEKYINGVNFNDQHRGVFNYSGIGALNDVTRNGDAVNYYSPSTFTFGAIGGSENINMRAGGFAKGGKLTASYTNRNYFLRGMATYSTGLMDDGYAFTVSVGGRYSDEGNVKGTYYNNFSYMFGMEKQWNGGEHSISFTTFGSPVERGQAHASYQEGMNLVDDNMYNPDWGYQNGKKRNSRVVKAFDPTAIASHVWKINRNVTLTTGIGAHYQRYGNTALNWYEGPDPRPDYYRGLPDFQGNLITDPELWGYVQDYIVDFYTGAWQRGEQPQLNWDKMIRINQLAVQAGDPEAIYMIEERRSDLFETSFNSTVNADLGSNIRLTAGIGLRTSESKQYKTVEDLLGAEYVTDRDKYAERDFGSNSTIIQNDLRRPDRKVYEGDVFGYDFRIKINSANLWVQNQHSYSNIDFFYGMKLSYTEFQRKGKMQNGRYPHNSYGNGKEHHFMNTIFKGGLTYKISGRHFITYNASAGTMAPLPYDAYISPRISDNSVELKSQIILSNDISYVFSLPSLNGRVSVFRTNFFDQMDKFGYYHDSQKTFVNHILTGVDKVHQGVELGLNYKLNNNWSFDLVGTVAEYYYSNNPMGTLNYENGSQENVSEKVYLKDYYVGSTPQIAGTLGVNFFYDYWFLNLNLNGFARNYIDIAPIRRLASNYTTVNPFDETYDAYKALLDQERYGSGYTVDFSIGKIFYLPKRQSFNFNLSFNNILNRKNVKTGGYEQGRLDLEQPGRFPSRYYYMQGFNCFLNASYRF